MPRTSKGPAQHARTKALLKKAKGYSRSKSRRVKIAHETVIRALRYAKRDRRVRKRHFRSLWITRIGAGCKARGFSYHQMIFGLNQAQVLLDRKILAHLAVDDTETFGALVDLAREQSAAKSRQAA